jgi:hypothetical protein
MEEVVVICTKAKESVSHVYTNNQWLLTFMYYPVFYILDYILQIKDGRVYGMVN